MELVLNVEKTLLPSNELSELLSITKEGLRKLTNRLGITPVLKEGLGRGGKVAYYDISLFPKEYQERINRLREKTVFSSLPKWQKELTLAKMNILNSLREEFLNIKNRRLSKERIISTFVELYNTNPSERMIDKISVRTVKRWLAQERKYRETNDLGYFAPQYGKKRGWTKLREEEKEFIRTEYLHPNRLNVLTIYEDYLRWCLSRRMKPVSYGTVLNFIKNIPLTERIVHREDKKNTLDKVMPYVERDKSSLKRGDIYCSDGHTFNFMVYDEVTKSWYRPTVVVWRDIATNKVVGWDIGKTENTDLILDSFAYAVRSNGVPRSVLIDNGKAYKNKTTKGFVLQDSDIKRLNGVFTLIGVEYVRHSLPYNAKAKPVESFWNVVNNKFSRKMVTYCGRNAEERKDSLVKIQKRMEKQGNYITLEDVYKAFGEWVEEYNNRKSDALNNLSPNEKWNSQTNQLRFIDERELPLCLASRKVLTVQRNGVRLFDAWYRDDDMHLIHKYLGQKVVVGIDRHNLSHCYVFDSEDKLLFELKRVEAVPFAVLPETTDELREINRDRKKLKDLIKRERSIKTRITERASNVVYRELDKEVKEFKRGQEEIIGLYD